VRPASTGLEVMSVGPVSPVFPCVCMHGVLLQGSPLAGTQPHNTTRLASSFLIHPPGAQRALPHGTNGHCSRFTPLRIAT
jgi:hypothetical protein